MNTNARNKLRRMGGIMASSPELMQAAQGYQAGGPVMTGPPTVPQVSGYAPGLLPTGTVDPRLGYSGRTAPISPAQARQNRALELGVESLRMDGPMTFGGGAQYRPTAPDMPFEPRGPEAGQPERMDARVMRGVLAGEGSMGDDAGVTVDDLLDGSGAGGFSVPVVSSTGPTGRGSDVDPVDNIDDLRAARGFGRSAYLSGLKGNVVDIPQDTQPFSTVREDKQGVLEEKRQELEKLQEDQFVDGIAKSSAAKKKEEKLQSTIDRLQGQVREDAEVQARKEEELMAMPLTPTRLTQEQIDKANNLAQKDPNFVFPETAPQPDTGGSDTGAGTGTGGGAGGPGPRTPRRKPTKKDLRSRYKEKIELFKEIYGEDDEDRARDKAMSLAMLGLAIASGQSPNALTNIAQGAMAGVQGMSEQEQARREREQGLQTLALETAIGEMDAEREAQARMAEAKYDRETRLAVARAGSAGGGVDFEAAPTVAEYISDSQKQLRKDVADSVKFVPERYAENPEVWYDAQKRQAGLNYIADLLPQMTPDQQLQHLQMGRNYLYQDPQKGNRYIVRNNQDLMFIAPGEEYVTPSGEVKTKPKQND